jgi:hypothetical protein
VGRAGSRLDQALAQLWPEHSRSRLKGWIDAGRVTVDGALAAPRRKLAELVLRDAFTAHFQADGPALPGYLAGRHRARDPWRLAWDASPGLFDDVGAIPLP